MIMAPAGSLQAARGGIGEGKKEGNLTQRVDKYKASDHACWACTGTTCGGSYKYSPGFSRKK